MRMYVWDGPKPWRDGSLEEGIVIHEVNFRSVFLERGLTKMHLSTHMVSLHV